MYLGIDIGGTSIKFAVFDDNYKIIHYETCKTPDNVTVKITDEMFRIASKIRESYNFNAAGISAAGVIDNNSTTFSSFWSQCFRNRTSCK